MAVAAKLEEASAPAGRSREPRRRLRLEASGSTSSGAATDVLVHNISTTGLLLESRASLAIGERIEIDLPHAEATGAKIIWASDRLFGCQFDAPVSPAVLSAAQLRSSVGQPLDIAAGSDESFGIRLQRLRKARGFTLSQIAAQLGVSKPTVWAWEQGKARPAESRLEALAQALGVARAELQPARTTGAFDDLLAKSREQIARAVGISPEKVRIMIEL